MLYLKPKINNNGMKPMTLKNTREFLLKENFTFLRDKVSVYDTDKNKLGYFKGSLFNIGRTYKLYNLDETPLLTVKEKRISLKSSYKFYKGGEKDDDNLIGELKKKILAGVPKFTFEDENGEEMFEIAGKIFRREYRVLKKENKVAEIDRKFFGSIIKNSFGVKMDENLTDEEALIILGVVIMLNHEEEEEE
ncbi:MAG: LURP-one-related family protein [Promethearchaeia archaeon]